MSKSSWPCKGLWHPTHQGFEESNLSIFFYFFFLQSPFEAAYSTSGYSNLSDAQESRDTRAGGQWKGKISMEGKDVSPETRLSGFTSWLSWHLSFFTYNMGEANR